MKSYKCEFCTHQVGPIKPLPPECIECKCGNHFQIKKKMHPMDVIAWEKHQRFDRFIDAMIDVPVVLWQREALHLGLEYRRPDRYVLYARGSGWSTERAMIDIFVSLFLDSEKGREQCPSNYETTKKKQ